jgi:hypothetical protein
MIDEGQDGKPGSFSLPDGIGEQILDAAHYFAVVLKNCKPDAEGLVPGWLSVEALTWIRGNAPAFSTLVLDAYEKLRAEQLAARPAPASAPTPARLAFGFGLRRRAAAG